MYTSHISAHATHVANCHVNVVQIVQKYVAQLGAHSTIHHVAATRTYRISAYEMNDLAISRFRASVEAPPLAISAPLLTVETPENTKEQQQKLKTMQKFGSS